MKWPSVVIRTVCLVLSVQIAASDAKSIGPSLSPAAAAAPEVAAAATAPVLSALTNTTARNEWNGANDPTESLLSGQEQHRVLVSTSNSNGGHYAPTGTSRGRGVKYTPKYSIDHLLEHVYDSKISNDIDLDPCKTVIAMGDVALPNVNYESQWQAQRFNKSFQAELETLKKEVYNEGLQVEEEGLTDIIRKKTKQIDPQTVDRLASSSSSDRERNNAVVLPEEDAATSATAAPVKHNFKSNPDPSLYAASSSHNHNHHRHRQLGEADEDEDEQSTTAFVATIIDSSSTRSPSQSTPSNASSSAVKVTLETAAAAAVTPTTTERQIDVEKNASAAVVRHNETDKIQSNSKDIVIVEDFVPRNGNGGSSGTTSSSSSNSNNHRRSTLSPPTNRQRNRRQHKVVTNSRRQHRQQKSSSREELALLVGDTDFQYTDAHRRVTRAATAKKERIWDHGVIPYEIDSNFSGAHKALFKQAMRHWENFTCIKFVERNPEEHPNYIVFTERSCGCCSYVGKRGNGAQAISIGKNCDKFGIVVHELGHVVGFWHEHTRPDRENHVVIEKSNILNGQEYNFNKLSEDDVNSLGNPYDYHSIMHYSRNTFSKSTHLDTIHPIEIKGQVMPEIGQRIRLSEGDIAQTNLLYKCPKCGQTFQDNSGTFASPHYYSNTPPLEPERCEWRITATHGERIVLNITDLDIFKSNNCRTDYLEIRDGYWHKSPIIGKFCGSGKVNELFTTTGSRMLITYVTSHRQGHHKGFTANYEAVCGGELVLEAGGRIESPNYPLDYLPNKECVWRISVPEEYQVALKFQSFEVENHDNCVYDYVEVRDGDTPDSRLIGVFCGYKIPPDMRSTGNKLYLKFVSDGSVQKAGFSANYMKEVDECETQNHGCQHECINTLGGYECACHIGYELHSDKKTCENACGGTIDAHNGTITSPSFPEVYPLSKDCIWEIVAPPQYKIILNFTHFDLEGSNFFQAECDYDSLTVYSKISDENVKRHGLFCGPKLPPMITSESNILRIEFTSDSTIQKSGFAAIFLTDIDECTINNGGCQHECKNTIGSYLCSCHNGYMLHENGHDCREGGCKYEVTAPHGQIASPNYPDYYPSNKDCVWHFSTTPGHRIKLQFTNFDVEPHQECVYDSIMMYDGDSTDSHTLGRFCGSKLPHTISASSNEMYMVFKSDASIQRTGFLATHSTGCGGYLQATNKVKHFYSHARYGHSSYDKLANCDWTIEAEMGKNIQLTFLTFDIEDEQACSFDYVEIFDGFGDSRGSSYGKFCGGTNPPDIISQSEALLVRFQSDETMVFKGFSVSYVAVVPFDDDEEMSSDSEETATAFPGSLKSIFSASTGDNENTNENDNLEVEKEEEEVAKPVVEAEVEGGKDGEEEYTEEFEGEKRGTGGSAGGGILELEEEEEDVDVINPVVEIKGPSGGDELEAVPVPAVAEEEVPEQI